MSLILQINTSQIKLTLFGIIMSWLDLKVNITSDNRDCDSQLLIETHNLQR